MKPKIVILGGGISGLAAAWYLQKKWDRFDIELCEASNRLGGVIGSEKSDRWLVELGADNFATLIPDALKMTQEMGLGEAMIHPNAENRLARVVCNGKVFPIPQGFSLMQPTRMDAILASRVLSFSGKLRVLAEYFVPARTSTKDESLRDFAIRRLGRQAFERLVEPIVGGIFTAQADRLSMQGAMPEFVEMERKYGGLIRSFLAKRKGQGIKGAEQKGPEQKGETPSLPQARQASGARYDQFVAPRLGMQWWLDQVTGKLDRVSIQLNKKAEQIVKKGNQWEILFQDQSSTTADGLIVALPAPSASPLLKAELPLVSSTLSEIPYASSAVVVMIVNRSEVDKKDLCFGIVIPQRESRNVLAISMSSEKYPGRVASDELLLRVFIGGAVRPDLFAKSDDELRAIAWNEVQSLLGLRTKPVWEKVVRWSKAMPQYHVGHLERLSQMEQALKAFPNLKLAGNAYRGVGIPQCVRSGRIAAEEIAVNFL